MIDFLNSSLGQIIARNGILALILAWSLYVNHSLTERLFKVIENNTQALIEVKSVMDENFTSAKKENHGKDLVYKYE